jgi:hypothetical protein
MVTLECGDVIVVRKDSDGLWFAKATTFHSIA